MDQDKIGNVLTGDDKVIAQPEAHVVENTPQLSSRRGVGHGWKNGDNRMPVLFGGGGHQDGVSALIQTFSNRQVEDEATLHGNGADAIDQNRYTRNQSNANTEFNFSQYKTGAMHTQRDGIFPGEGKVTVANTDGASSGDMMLRVDPYSDILDMTTQAVGAIYGNVYKMGGVSTTTNKMGVNPFRGGGEKEDEAKADTTQATMEDEEDDDGYDLNYYFDSEYHEGQSAADKVQEDFDTGLRRVNMKTSQGRQLEAVASKTDIIAAYQAANDQYAQVLKDHMGKAHLSMDDRQIALEKLRPSNSKYRSAQVGVTDMSRETAKRFRKSKDQSTKLNTMLVGV